MIKRVLRKFSETHCALYSLDQGIQILSLQRQKPKNALGRLLVQQLTSNLQTIRSSPARVVIVQSKIQGIFCAGADLKQRAEMTPEEANQFVRSLRNSFTMLQELEIPTIGCIEGYALGGGLQLALACDIRVATPTSILGFPQTSLAILPGAGGTQRLPRLIGVSRAKEMIFTGKRYTAQEVEKYGLLNFVQEDAKSFAMELARKIAENGPIGVKMAKKAIDVSFNTGSMEVERLCYFQTLHTNDRLEGLQAFKEKRKPVYKGE